MFVFFFDLLFRSERLAIPGSPSPINCFLTINPFPFWTDGFSSTHCSHSEPCFFCDFSPTVKSASVACFGNRSDCLLCINSLYLFFSINTSSFAITNNQEQVLSVLGVFLRYEVTTFFSDPYFRTFVPGVQWSICVVSTFWRIFLCSEIHFCICSMRSLTRDRFVPLLSWIKLPFLVW